MIRFLLLTLLALMLAPWPVSADHHRECLPPEFMAYDLTTISACHGHSDRDAYCGWSAWDGHDHDYVSLDTSVAEVDATSGDHTTCPGPGETQSCTTWRTQAEAGTDRWLYVGLYPIGGVGMTRVAAGLETDRVGESCGAQPQCTGFVTVHDRALATYETLSYTHAPCQDVSDLEKPTPGTPEAPDLGGLCQDAGGATACRTYEPFVGADCNGSNETATLGWQGAEAGFYGTTRCSDVGNYYTGPCYRYDRSYTVAAHNTPADPDSTTTVGLDRSYKDGCSDPLFTPFGGACRNTIWMHDEATGYSGSYTAPQGPGSMCTEDILL